MDDALSVLREKRRKNGRWPMQGAHPGKVHLTTVQAGRPSRWNTLLALRGLGWFDPR